MKNILKKFYSLIPFKKYIFLWLRNVWSPPLCVYQHLYFDGVINININEKVKFKMIHHGYQIENELFWLGLYGGFEKHSISIWSELTKLKGVVFDIGANTGLYSLIAKTNNIDSSVHAFEPFPAIYNLLMKNCNLNFYDIKCNCLAVSNASGDGVFYTDNENFAYSASVNNYLGTENPIGIDIKTITLRDYIVKNNISTIDLIKIDVETHEPEVMEGFYEYYKLFEPIFLIEVLNEVVANKLKKYFPPDNYDFYNINELIGVRKVNSISQSDSYNFYFIPKSKRELMNRVLLNLYGTHLKSD